MRNNSVTTETFCSRRFAFVGKVGEARYDDPTPHIFKSLVICVL
jgi:hypothetical protein